MVDVKDAEITALNVGDEVSVIRDVPMNQTRKYAEVSGDFNPIHIDEEFAKSVGFDGIIVHGLCTLAYCTKLFTDLAKAPDKLKKIKVRFARPLYPGSKLTIKATVTEREGTKLTFEFGATTQDGTDVIKNGVAVIDLA